MECHECLYSSWTVWDGGFDILRIRTLSSYGDIRKPLWRIGNWLLHMLQNKLRLGRALPPYPIYGGSVYMSLTKDAVKEALYNALAKDLLNRLGNSTCGEEIYFQTVLMNSPCRDYIIGNNLRYIDIYIK